MFNFINNIGPTEILLLVAILVFFFGTKVVTNLARTAGMSLKELKGIKNEFIRSLEDEPKAPAQAPIQVTENGGVNEYIPVDRTY